MTTSPRAITRVTCSVLAFLLVTAVASAAAPDARNDARNRAPRNVHGQPDLQGVWNFNSDVPLERPKEFADRAFLTPEERDKRIAARDAGLDQLAKLVAIEVADKVYLDFAPHAVNLRTSLIVYPENGRMPKLVDGVQRVGGLAAILRGDDFPGRRPARFLFGGIGKDGPEDRGLSERCLIADNANPPLSPGFDNNYIQIFQSSEHVILLTETLARIVPLDGRPHLGDKLRSWTGDSRGRWEGDTLVVETRNFNGLTQSFNDAGTSYGKVVTERFTRASANAIEYEVTIVDPKTFEDRIVVAFPMAKVDARMFETACHEGNYSMPMTLAGARKQERD